MISYLFSHFTKNSFTWKREAKVDVFSWFVCFPGIGAGVSSSIFGFLTRSTAPEDRATVFAAFMACRQAGLVIGQCLFAFLRQILKIV